VILLQSDPLKYALAYAELGLLVFPVHSMRDGKCSCRDPDNCEHPGKHPRTRNGVKSATKDPQRIKRWWKKNPDANVGIATGADSGIMVIDSDPRHGGDKTLEHLLKRLGALPITVVAKTGGEGRHYAFAHPGGSVKNAVGVAPGIDVRGDNGYVLAPPSNHFSGGRYEWLPSFDPWSTKPAALPITWLEWLRSLGVIWTPRGPNGAEGLQSAIAQMAFVKQAVASAKSEALTDSSAGQEKTNGERYREIQNSRQRDTEAIQGDCGDAAHAKSWPVSSLDELTAAEKQAVLRAIRRNLPKAPGERNQKRLFAFARAIAGIPRLRGAGEVVLRPIVQAYYEAASPRTSGTHCFEDYWDEFRYGLDRVRFPGEFNMIEIIEAVAGQPAHPACAAKGYVEPRRVLLLGLCAELQKRHGEAPFFLSCALAASLLTQIGYSTEAMQVHRMFDSFRRNALLEIVQKGNRHQATRYRFGWRPGAT
jgi:hypothetical protein